MMRFQVVAAVLSLTFGLGISTGAYAAEKKGAAAKEVTLKGQLLCAKCSLKESAKCENVLKVTEGAKETKYYLAQNDVSHQQHEKVCSGAAAATVTGTVSKADGKNVLTAETITFP